MKRGLVFVMGLVLLVSGIGCFDGNNIPKLKNSKGTLTGTVLVKDSGVQVVNAPLTVFNAENVKVGEGATGEDGTFSLKVAAGDDLTLVVGSLVFSGKTYKSVSVSDIDLNVNELEELGTLYIEEMILTGTITGTIIVNGQPVSGVTVIVQDASGNTVATTTSDANGNISVVVPVGEGYTVVVVADENQAGSTINNVSVAENGSTDIGSVTVEPSVPAVVTGTVTGAVTVNGTPVAGATVTVQDAAGNTVASGTTDGNGNFSIEVPVGEGYIVVIGGNGEQTGTTITGVNVVEGGTTELGGVTVAPVIHTGTIAGTVVSGGQPVAGITVVVTNAAGNQVGTAVTDASGNYSIVVPVGSGYTVTIVANNDFQGNSQSGITVVEGETTQAGTVSVTPVIHTGTIAGTIISGGQPVAGITVVVTNVAGSQVGTAVTDASGNYSIVVPEGSGYTVSIVGNGSFQGNTQSGITVVAGQTTALGDTTVLPATGTIAGTVISEGQPVSGITVIVTNSSGNQVATITTNASGAYSFEVGVGSGYTVTVVGNSSFNGASQSGIIVVAGQTSTVGAVSVTPVLKDGVLAGKILAFADGSPVNGAVVNIFSANGVKLGSTSTAVDGSFSLTVTEGINLSLEIPAYNIYDRASKSGLRVYPEQTTNVSVIYLTDSIVRADGAVQGIIVDAINGSRIGTAAIEVHIGGANGPIATLVDKNNAATSIQAATATDATGFFKIGSENPLDNSLLDGQIYTVVIKKNGYTNAVVENLSVDGLTDIGTVSLVPVLPAGQISITLKWQPDGYPADKYNNRYTRDLDGHLVGPKTDGNWFHVYWDDKNADGKTDESSNGTLLAHPVGAWQDIDDTDYGSRNGETISMDLNSDQRAAGTYSYTVHNYNSCGTVNYTWGGGYGTCYNEYLNKQSNAVVTVYDNYGMLAQVAIPENQTWQTNGWKVFELVIAADKSYQVNVINSSRKIEDYTSTSNTVGVRSASFFTDPIASFIANDLKNKTK